MEPKIYLAFRFHGNFYHSYRGDTPDELGFGKDIRIIRQLIKTLDDYNQRGVPVCGTWDFENYFSLETIMPEHCPDIIASLQRRVSQGRDEVQLMSYNNGLVNAHTAREFEQAISRAITNQAGSGLRDLFGDGYVNMVRPQEMMYTPIHLKLYRALGVDSISLYYSAIPFNGFSTFIPPLSLAERYNPLTLTYPGIEQTMTLLPCYNMGDLADHISLRRWVKSMRREQLAAEHPQDLLLVLDQDADDEFWIGFDVPGFVRRMLPGTGGIGAMLDSLAGLNYISFTTPGRYLADHQPLGSVSFGQDTADGSFDGLSSWVEKWSNHELFTGLERARILALQTQRLLEGAPSLSAPINDLLEQSFEARLKILSTTHFGMASPVMNLTRERVARDLVRTAVSNAAAALEEVLKSSTELKLAVSNHSPHTFSLVDYVRGETTHLVQYQAHPSRALLRLALRPEAPERLCVLDQSGQPLPSAIVKNGGARELFFVENFAPLEHKHYSLVFERDTPSPSEPVIVTGTSLQNEHISIHFNQDGSLTSLKTGGQEYSLGSLLNGAVVYGKHEYQVKAWSESACLAVGIVGVKRLQAELILKGGYPVRFEHEIMLAAGLPYIYLTVRVEYPRTPDKGYTREKAARLQQAWDNAWKAVMPCEIRPALSGTSDRPLQVWKHNFCNHTSSFDIDYDRFSKNFELDSINNQITHAWLAVSDGEKGLLVAQCADTSSSVAFCPLRTRLDQGATRIRFNPFGSYWGRQYQYPTADTGLGKAMAAAASAATHINPYAPSYNGRRQEFRLFLAPYAGDAPPETTCFDAEAFAYPYIVLSDEAVIVRPPHRSWAGAGLGEIS